MIAYSVRKIYAQKLGTFLLRKVPDSLNIKSSENENIMFFQNYFGEMVFGHFWNFYNRVKKINMLTK